MPVHSFRDYQLALAVQRNATNLCMYVDMLCYTDGSAHGDPNNTSSYSNVLHKLDVAELALRLIPGRDGRHASLVIIASNNEDGLPGSSNVPRLARVNKIVLSSPDGALVRRWQQVLDKAFRKRTGKVRRQNADRDLLSAFQDR